MMIGRKGQSAARYNNFFDIYPVAIKICMTEYHNLIHHLAHGVLQHYILWGEMSMVFLVTCIYSPFEALNIAFEVQFLRT